MVINKLILRYILDYDEIIETQRRNKIYFVKFKFLMLGVLGFWGDRKSVV